MHAARFDELVDEGVAQRLVGGWAGSVVEFTSATLVLSVPGDGMDAALLLVPMMISFARWARVPWCSRGRPRRFQWKMTWWAVTARSPRLSPPVLLRWARRCPACSKARSQSVRWREAPVDDEIAVRAGVNGEETLHGPADPPCLSTGGGALLGDLRPHVALLEPVQPGGAHHDAGEQQCEFPAAESGGSGAVWRRARWARLVAVVVE